MGHEIAFNAENEAMMVSSNDNVWHRLGQRADGLMTTTQALELARLDWLVHKRNLWFTDDNGNHIQVPKTYTVVRPEINPETGEETLVPLTRNGKAVGERYTPFQNADAFAFLDDLLNEQGAVVDTAGALGLGERVWILAELPDHITIGSKDEKVGKYLLIYNTHDGTGSIIIQPTLIRVVCNNTLSMSLKEDTGYRYKMRHTTNVANKIEEVKEAMKLTNETFDNWGKMARKALKTKLTTVESTEYIIESLKLGFKKDEEGLITDELTTRSQNILDKVTGLLDKETNTVGRMKNTLWATYNAITEYIDHHSWDTDKIKGTTTRKKQESIQFGALKEKKINAWNKLEAMVKQ